MSKRDDSGYKNNPNLKRIGTDVEWTPELIKEYKRCRDDVIYFIQTYVKIINVDKGPIVFRLYDFQKELINLFNTNRFVVAKCPRQVGKSTIVAAYLLHYILFNSNVNVAVLAHKESAAMEIVYRIQTAYEHLPKWIQQGVGEWNKKSIILENGSRLKSAATSASSIRGGSYNLVFLDEFAHVNNEIAKEFFSSVWPTISSGKTTRMFMVTTPLGMNHFHKLWVDAENKRNEWVPFAVHWSDVPGRDEEWKDTELKQLGEQLFRQEVLCEFIGSANTLIKASKLESLVYVPPKETRPDTDIYETPQKDHTYVCVVDVGEGTGGDYSVISVFDCTKLPYKHVAKYRSNEISTMMLPAAVYSVATHYNNAWVLIELNNGGGEVARDLYYDYEYEYMLRTTNIRFEKSKLALGGGPSTQLGVKTSKSVKQNGCSNLKQMIEQDTLITNDHDTIEELHRFVKKRGSYAAANDDDHDDIVMTLVLFAWVSTQQLFKEITNTDAQKALRQEKMQNPYNEVAPFGLFMGGDGVPDDAQKERVVQRHVNEDGTGWEVRVDDVFGWPVVDYWDE